MTVPANDNFGDLFSDVPFVEPVENVKEFDQSYTDIFSTAQQKARDEKITLLLTHYTESYNEKRKTNQEYKSRLFELCYNIVSGFSFALIFIVVILLIVDKNGLRNVENIALLITACVTYITTIIGLLKIITDYVFPQKEEEYVTKIVELIQKNDLEHKKANMRAGIPGIEAIQLTDETESE